MAREFSRKFYKSKQWTKAREYIFNKYHGLCNKCGAPGEEVHHIIWLSPKNIRKKNIKPRRVPMSKKLKSRLKAYIDDKEDYEYMFKSNKGDSHIEVDTISKILKKAGEYLGLYYTTAHCMRKTYAYKIYVESGYDIIAVKEMLGHSSIEETKLYLDLERLKYDTYSKSLDDFL